MDKNEKALDPLEKVRSEISQKQASEKAVNDVLNYDRSEPDAETPFVQSTREELGEENTSATSPSAQTPSATGSHNMPSSERVTEKD